MVIDRQWDAWIWTCVMGLLPFTLWLVVHAVIVGGHHNVAAQASRELLFFALSTSTLALVTLRATPPRQRIPYSIVYYVCLLILIVAAVLYGMFLTSEALHAAIRGEVVYSWSRGIAGFALCFGAAVRYFSSNGD